MGSAPEAGRASKVGGGVEGAVGGGSCGSNSSGSTNGRPRRLGDGCLLILICRGGGRATAVALPRDKNPGWEIVYVEFVVFGAGYVAPEEDRSLAGQG